MMNAEHRKLLEQEMVNFCLKVKMFILKVMFHHQISYLSYNEKYLLLALLPFLYACSNSPNQGINYDEAFAKDTQGLDILTGQFSHNIDRIWVSMNY